MADKPSAISHQPRRMPVSGLDERPNILVVDDEPDMCWALDNILNSAGYQITTTTNGKEAMELMEKTSFQVVFIDAKLPDLDGLELAALIRQRSPYTAIVLISGYYYQEDRAINEGLEKNLFVGFISKPFDLEEVRLMARRAVECAKRARKGGQADGPHSTGG
jgi:DNA-binding NtrC family response regulator